MLGTSKVTSELTILAFIITQQG